MRARRRWAALGVGLAAAATSMVAAGAPSVALAPADVTVSPDSGLAGPATVTVEASGVVDLGGIATPIGPVWRPGLYQCDAGVAALERATVSGSEVLGYGAAVDAVCAPLATDVAVVAGEISRSVVVHQPFTTGGTTPLSNTATTVDCSVNGCVVLALAASGSFDGFSGTVSIDTFETVPIDFLPTIRAGAVSTPEGDVGTTVVDLPLELSEPVPTPVSVDWEVVGDSATVGPDVVAASGTATFPAGITQTTVPVEVVGDEVHEREVETAWVELSDPPAVAPHVVGPGVVSIVDDDVDLSALVVEPDTGLRSGDLVAVAATGIVDQGGLLGGSGPTSYRPAAYQCTSSFAQREPSSLPAVVDLGFLFDVWGSCRALTEPLAVPGGVLEATVAVERVFETTPGPVGQPVRVDCRLAGCVLAVFALSGDPFSTMTLDSFETASIGFVPSVLPGAVTVWSEGDDGSSTWNVPVRLSAPAAQAVTVDYRMLGNPGNPFVAIPGVDAVDTSGTITFAPGETEAVVPVEVLGDTLDEPPLLWGEWGVVLFENVTGPAELDTSGFFGAGLFVILDDD